MVVCLVDYDPAAFDIIREDRERDTRDYRDDRYQEREQERPRREEERPRSPSREMAARQAMETIVNDDSIVLSDSMVRAVNDPGIRMTRNGELTRLMPQADRAILVSMSNGRPGTKRRSRNTKYRRAYKTAFRKCKSKHTKKDGTWKKDGFRRCVQEAHSIARKKT